MKIYFMFHNNCEIINNLFIIFDYWFIKNTDLVAVFLSVQLILWNIYFWQFQKYYVIRNCCNYILNVCTIRLLFSLIYGYNSICGHRGVIVTQLAMLCAHSSVRSWHCAKILLCSLFLSFVLISLPCPTGHTKLGVTHVSIIFLKKGVAVWWTYSTYLKWEYIDRYQKKKSYNK